jgi:hypothetical protein
MILICRFFITFLEASYQREPFLPVMDFQLWRLDFPFIDDRKYEREHMIVHGKASQRSMFWRKIPGYMLRAIEVL